ncbi:MAG: hypothetical protein HY314_02135 [Acidobacteria bacterium]|nr:hypothetical protein [Acidobacteriota bacterium]
MAQHRANVRNSVSFGDGVYKSTDGGKTWQKVLYIDSEHGVADLDIDPSNPNILYAAMWHFERKPWTYHSGSEKGGVFESGCFSRAAGWHVRDEYA